MDKNELFALYDNLFPDNDSKFITPSRLRQGLQQLTSATLNLDEIIQQDVFGPVTADGANVNKAAFIATSQSAFTISGSNAAPSFLPIDSVFSPNGFELFDAATGAIKNVSGRTLKVVVGTISLNQDGGSNTINLVSESSIDDGVTWAGNLNSLRKLRVTEESFQTKLSLAVNWQNNQIIRFRAYETGGGSVDCLPSSETILAQPFTGPSLAWDLQEA